MTPLERLHREWEDRLGFISPRQQAQARANFERARRKLERLGPRTDAKNALLAKLKSAFEGKPFLVDSYPHHVVSRSDGWRLVRSPLARVRPHPHTKQQKAALQDYRKFEMSESQRQSRAKASLERAARNVILTHGNRPVTINGAVWTPHYNQHGVFLTTLVARYTFETSTTESQQKKEIRKCRTHRTKEQ